MIAVICFPFMEMSGMDFPVLPFKITLITAGAAIIALLGYNAWVRNKNTAIKAATIIGCLLLLGIGAGILLNNIYISRQISDLSSPDSETRSAAAYNLRDKKAKRAVEPLIEALKDDEFEVRYAGRTR